MRLLGVGDLHLGRRSGRLPDAVKARLGERRLGPAGALERLVEAARREGVDVVAFAGDVVEQADDFFEAFAELRRGVTALVESGITVVGVAGNHDVQVLPQLAEEVAGFRLLGRGGTWEAVDLTGADGTTVRVYGWSFPSPITPDNPLAGQSFNAPQGPMLGLLHCDRDHRDSHHAPVSSRELHAAGLDAWLLGHIHKPDALAANQPSGYLGSVTALRASETGARGPWLYTIESGEIRSITHWPLAPLRWEVLDVDLTDLADATEARSRILASAEATARQLSDDTFRPDALGLRLRLHGRTRLRREVAALLANEDLSDLPLAGGMHGFVGHWWLNTRPEIDLQTLAQRPDPAGLLARRLQLLEDAPAGDPERQALLDRARAHLQAVQRDPAWSRLDTSDPDEATLLDWLRRGALTSLDELLAQRREGTP
ncbi:metallophosphoesterase [Aquisalimonas sp.]|uniref:metallophosphoesterase family protein n=1 Tax=Aquisalimonas sp. TaxID=1872621 RepID=UPI0025C0E43E|nr:metallophosphoesterase [Aquisalimonas sp.]